MLWYIVHCVHFWSHFKSHSACPALQCQKCNYAECTHTQTSQHFFYPRTCFLVLIVNVQLRCGGEERGGGKFECRKRERKKLCNNGVKVIEFFDWCATTQNIVITFVMHSYTHTESSRDDLRCVRTGLGCLTWFAFERGVNHTEWFSIIAATLLSPAELVLERCVCQCDWQLCVINDENGWKFSWNYLNQGSCKFESRSLFFRNEEYILQFSISIRNTFLATANLPCCRWQCWVQSISKKGANLLRRDRTANHMLITLVHTRYH